MEVEDWNPERVKRLRKAYRLTRKQLGDLTGVTITSIYLWEMGQRKPSRTAEILLSRIEEELKGRVITSKRKRGGENHGKRDL